jgi:hypothetical protein
VPLEDLEALAGVHIPQAKGFVSTSGNGDASVGSDGKKVYRIGMPLEDSETRAGVHIPDAKGIVTAP